MDYLEALYSIQSTSGVSQAASTAQNTETQATDSAFDELLASMLGTSQTSASGSSLLTGLLDVSDSSQLVSALLGSSSEDDASLLTGMETGGMSGDSLSALMNLSQTNEQEWLTQMLENFSSTAESGEKEDTLSAYYTAMAALSSAQKNILLT